MGRRILAWLCTRMHNAQVTAHLRDLDDDLDVAACEQLDAPVRAGIEAPDEIATGGPSALPAAVEAPPAPDRLIDVAIIGASGYVGGELVRLLSRHPAVRIVGLLGHD